MIAKSFMHMILFYLDEDVEMSIKNFPTKLNLKNFQARDFKEYLSI